VNARDHYSCAASYAFTALMAAAVTTWTAGTSTAGGWGDTAAIVLGITLTATAILAALHHTRRGRNASSNGGPS